MWLAWSWERLPGWPPADCDGHQGRSTYQMVRSTTVPVHAPVDAAPPEQGASIVVDPAGGPLSD